MILSLGLGSSGRNLKPIKSRKTTLESYLEVLLQGDTRKCPFNNNVGRVCHHLAGNVSIWDRVVPQKVIYIDALELSRVHAYRFHCMGTVAITVILSCINYGLCLHRNIFEYSLKSNKHVYKAPCGNTVYASMVEITNQVWTCTLYIGSQCVNKHSMSSTHSATVPFRHTYIYYNILYILRQTFSYSQPNSRVYSS